jgi:hypothetical protein
VEVSFIKTVTPALIQNHSVARVSARDTVPFYLDLWTRETSRKRQISKENPTDHFSRELQQRLNFSL